MKFAAERVLENIWKKISCIVEEAKGRCLLFPLEPLFGAGVIKISLPPTSGLSLEVVDAPKHHPGSFLRQPQKNTPPRLLGPDLNAGLGDSRQKCGFRPQGFFFAPAPQKFREFRFASGQ
jgi:hypothetical protein